MLDRGRKAALYAYFHGQAQNLGRSAAGGEGMQSQESPTPPQPEPTPEPDPVDPDKPDVPDTPDEPTIIEYDMVWDFIHDEQSWNDAYNRDGSALKRYYEDHPEEDLWNIDENRNVNFNDRWYEGTFDGEPISCGTQWVTTKSQKLTINGVVYYCEIWGYTLDPKTVELFVDPDLTQSAEKTFEITKVTFSPKHCKHCWEGTINAGEAQLPWVVVDPKSPYDLSKSECKIEFQYNGSSVYPWDEDFRKFRSYGVASLPVELGIDAIDPNNQEATDTFDKSKLAVKGYVKLT